MTNVTTIRDKIHKIDKIVKYKGYWDTLFVINIGVKVYSFDLRNKNVFIEHVLVRRLFIVSVLSLVPPSEVSGLRIGRTRR